MSDLFPFDHFLKSNKKPEISKLPLKKEEKAVEDQGDLEFLSVEIQKILKLNIPEKKYSTFFEDEFVLEDIGNQIAVFRVPTEVIKSMIEGHYTDVIKSAVEEVMGKPHEIEIRVKSNQIPYSKTSDKRTAKDHKFKLDLDPTEDDLRSKIESKYIDHMNPEQPQGLLIDSNKKFDNFIIGASNNLAFATAKAVAKNPGKRGKYPSLYIHSNSGLGKTHLLHAVANEIKDQFPHLVICLITARDFMNEMIRYISTNKIADFRKKYSEKIDVLMIDDIHELQSKQGTQNEFFHIFNELHNKGKQLIFTSDKAPKEIDGIEERIKTRLSWGLVVDIQRPDLETRIAILKRKAQELDLYCSEDVISLIASSVKSSIRELEGSLIRLSAYAEVMGIEIDADIVREQLNLQSASEEKQITLDIIARATGQYFKIPLADLKSKSRNKDIAKARHIAIYLSRKLIKATQQDIGRFYGGRDHTSIIHASKKIQEQLKTDSALSRDVLEIENSL